MTDAEFAVAWRNVGVVRLTEKDYERLAKRAFGLDTEEKHFDWAAHRTEQRAAQASAYQEWKHRRELV